MNQEGAYTDEQLREVAEKVANYCYGGDFSSTLHKCINSSSFNTPLEKFVYFSKIKNYNPLGHFAIEASDLTVSQKVMVTGIIEAACDRYYRSPNAIKYFKEQKRQFRDSFSRMSTRDELPPLRDADLERRLRNLRNHEF
ncbi:MAG: hypothetical protein PF904_15150 [Kiritimatiellae bacterium]|jgi:hypothetical protein|nr:hypothetical protein [Kiritimatiellia bacterium]